jgi:hypothetical protein
MNAAQSKAKRRRAVPATEPVTEAVAPTAETVAAAPGAGLPPVSTEAKRLAAAILEVLAGARTPTEAGQLLGISLCRYYQLRTRALNGLLAACESRRRGGRHRPVNDLAALRQECERLRRESARQQALLRAAQRTVGLAAPPPISTAASGKQRRKRRPVARALKMAALLQSEGAAADAQTVAADPAGAVPQTLAAAAAAASQ